MTNQLPSEPTPRSRRFALKSIRPALTVSAVVLSVVGISQITGTSAAFQDTATGTSGALTVATKVLPEVASVGCDTTGQGTGSQDARLKWNHIGPAYKYRVDVYKEGSSTPYSGWDKDPGVGFATGGEILSSVTSDDTEYQGGGQNYIAQVHTVNRYTGEKSVGWRGYKARRGGLTWNVWCEAAVPGSISASSGESEFLRAQAAPSTTPSPAATTTTAAPSTTTPSSTTTAPSSTTTSPQSTTPATTTAPTTTTTTPSTTTAQSTATTTTSADTTMGTAVKSNSNDYSAALVRSSETSQTAIVISDANGEELKRIAATASTQYKWDSSTDTLWIVEGSQLYKASGSTWTKTSVDPSSSDVPADIAALVD